MNKVQKPYSKSIKELEATLGTSAAFGLEEKRARLRYEPQNANGFFFIGTSNYAKRIIETLSDPMLIMLLIMVVVSAIFGSAVMSILSGVFLFFGVRSVLLAYTKARRIVVRVSHGARPRATVIRSGKKAVIDSGKVVVGDLLVVQPGDIVPCDARIVSSERLKVRIFAGNDKYIEAEPNGEISYVEEIPNSLGYENMLYAGSLVTNGTATAIVTAIGEGTYAGENFGGVKIGDASSPSETLKKLRKFTKIYELAALAAVLVFTVIGVFTYGVDNILFTFMLTLSTAVSALGEMLNILCRVLIAGNVKTAAENGKNNDAAILKSYDKIEKIAGTDALFLVGDKTITDGVRRVISVYTAGKALMPDNFAGTDMRRAAEYYATFSHFSGSKDECDVAFAEFAEKSLKIDLEKLNKRFEISRKNETEGSVVVLPLDIGGSCEISVTDDISTVDKCESFGLDSGTSVFAANEKKKLLDFCIEAVGRGGKMRILTTKRNNGKLVFEGAFVFRKLVSRSVSDRVAKLKNAGVETLLFLQNGGISEVSEAALAGISQGRSDVLSANDFDGDISACVGRYRVYLGFDADFIGKLAAEYKSAGKTVSVFSENSYGYKSFLEADVSVTANNSSQILRSASDVLVDKCSVKGGGINGVFKIVSSARVMLTSMKRALIYLICSQIMRLIYVVPPLLLGVTLLTPEEILFSSLVLDIAAVISFVFIKPKNEMQGPFNMVDFSFPYKFCRTEMIISAIAAAFVVVTSLVLNFAAGVNFGIPAFILLVLSQAGIYSWLVFKK